MRSSWLKSAEANGPINRWSDMTATAPEELGTIRRQLAPTVLVTADDLDSATRIADAISDYEAIKEIHVVGSLEQALDTTSGEVIVWYVDSVGSDEVSSLARIRQDGCSLPIIVVCGKANARTARRISDAGADGVVLASQMQSALGPTIGAVSAGQTVIPRDLRPSVANPFLSYRERQVLGMVVMGFTNCEIGSRLFLAESTVKSHLSSAFSKLGVRSRSEASALILDPEGPLGTGILAITASD